MIIKIHVFYNIQKRKATFYTIFRIYIEFLWHVSHFMQHILVDQNQITLHSWYSWVDFPLRYVVTTGENQHLHVAKSKVSYEPDSVCILINAWRDCRSSIHCDVWADLKGKQKSYLLYATYRVTFQIELKRLEDESNLTLKYSFISINCLLYFIESNNLWEIFLLLLAFLLLHV